MAILYSYWDRMPMTKIVYFFITVLELFGEWVDSNG